MHGLAVTTVEGIGSTKTKLHPVQERIAKAHGSQCGFCTPGIVMSMYTLLRNRPRPTMNDMEVAFQGNLCRCTGYRPIIEGYKTFTEEWELIQNGQKLSNGCGSNGFNGCGMGDKCCKFKGTNSLTNGNMNGSNCVEVNGNGTADKNSTDLQKTKQKDNDKNATDDMKNANMGPQEILYNSKEFTPYDPSQEPIFPPELKLSDTLDKDFLVIKGKTVTWYRPTKLYQLLSLKKKYPEAKIVVGNTEIGVEVKFKHMVYPFIIQPVQIPELVEIKNTPNTIRIGASVTLIDFENALSKEMVKLPEQQTRVFRTIVGMLNWFAGKQIRSVGALGSNIMTGSPISDMLPIMMANKVTLEVASEERGTRNVVLDEHFFTGYRKSVVKPDEILLAIHIPYTNSDTYCYSYKQARRREDDIAIVNACVKVTFEPKTDVIKNINLAFGGMSFKTVTAPITEQKLKGLPWNKNTLEIAYTHLLEDLPLDAGAPGGMILYRRSLTLSLFFRAFLAISSDLQKYLPHVSIDKRDLTAIEGFHTKNYKSSQYFTVVPQTQEKTDALQRPIVHMSAFKQATGEAIYCDDIPFCENELYLAYVTSSRAHAKIISIDPEEALSMEGVYYFVSSKDISKEHNKLGSIVHDEKVFYTEEVTSQGQIIGGIVAIDQITAQRAARKVKVEYEDIHPVVVSIEDAIKYSSYFEYKKKLQKGDIDKVLREAPHVLEGECRMGGQEHFYLETQCVLAVPMKEDNEFEVYCSTQNPTEVTVCLYLLAIL